MTNLSDFSNELAAQTAQAAQSMVTVLAPQSPVTGTVIGTDEILTVAHVLHADEVEVLTPDGRTLTATVAGRDPSSDLALLKVDGLNMPALVASAGARMGELLLALGRPQAGPQLALGLMPGVPEASPHKGWLQSGAVPFRGVSGGALLDVRGGLVGLLNAGLSRGTLLAVPAERALKVATQLATAGRVPQGYLGMLTQPVRFPAPTADVPADYANEGQTNEGQTSEGQTSEGQTSAQHQPDPRRGWGGPHQRRDPGHHRDPEQRGGWRPGQWGRGPFGQFGPFGGPGMRSRMRETAGFEGRGPWGKGWGGPGQERGGQEGHGPDKRVHWEQKARQWADQWAERGSAGPAEDWRGFFGPRGFGPQFGPRGFGPGHVEPEDVQPGRLGLTIIQVDEGSPAAVAGLMIGDILLALNGQPLNHPRELLHLVRDQAGEQLVARILRAGTEQDVNLTVGER